ncbi:integral membrane protein [Rutstroemia sp. NJR-2017a WRK4]|nr:integral membrane protein [Rutstroemia sp. NJR-2017a WRK4]
MVVSALLGKTPLTPDDKLIARALRIIAPSEINPNISEPFGTPAPPNASHDSHAKSLIIGEAFAIFFILLFTATRLSLRKWRSKFWGPDDWVIIPAAFGAISYLSLDIVGQTRGCLGKHIWDCTYDKVAWFIYCSQIEEPLFYFTVFCVKLSISLANKRLTGLASRTWSYIHIGFITTFLCLLPITTFLNMFQCLPVPAGYSLWYIGAIPDPKTTMVCLNRVAISYATRILHILTDVALLCVPITIVIRLRMPRAKKYRLIAIFAVGGMSTLASILRNVFISKDQGDFTYDAYVIWCFDIIDITFAVIVASLPALNGVLETAIQRLSSFRSSDASGSGATRPPTFGTGASNKKWKGFGRTLSETNLAGMHGQGSGTVEDESSHGTSHLKPPSFEQPIVLEDYRY